MPRYADSSDEDSESDAFVASDDSEDFAPVGFIGQQRSETR